MKSPLHARHLFQRLYSMSSQISQERDAYYDIQERMQKGTLGITPWMEWFLGCLGRAFEGTEKTLAAVLHKARFWQKYEAITMNERQRLILDMMLVGFEGKQTSSKWAKLAKCSRDTAIRDIQKLIGHAVLRKGPGGGRSMSCSLQPN